MADITFDESKEPNVVSLVEHFLRRGKLFHALEVISFTGTTLEQEMLIRNPVSSGVNLIIFKIEAVLDIAATTNQLNQIVLDVRKNPTVSATGGAITSSGNKKSGSSNSHQAQLFGQPTFTGANTDTIMGDLQINRPAILKNIILEPGNDLAVRCRANDAANSGFIMVEWAEDTV